MPVRIKRVYAEPEADDGERILVDRLWPRGVSRQKAAFAEWMKDVAPSTELRKWFDHKPERWAEFQTRYREELKDNPAIDDLKKRAASGTVTLLYGSRNTQFNHAAVLADVLLEVLQKQYNKVFPAGRISPELL
ncbi:DUF488 domain-containing protein [Shinella sp. CPCC 101442]|uniref:DUF488 domain-containing protein n=1 Tax=Shinella sp. CPCC 101442 TaxID=2932265 RepID=UPI002152B30E|nr:DUF488 domain-containing protein [Shinella sp. CPCC 101442]MCR6500592.1 DUF488 domain-containing protein [Shinella sp. CPCC 101442]